MQSLDRLAAKPFPALAKTRPGGRLLVLTPSPRMSKNLADRQMGQHAHGKHDPQHDFVSELTSTPVGLAAFPQDIPNTFQRNDLLQTRQTI